MSAMSFVTCSGLDLSLCAVHLCILVNSVYYHTSKHVQSTINNVPDSQARVVCGDS